MAMQNKLYGFNQNKRIFDANALKANLHCFKRVYNINDWITPSTRHMLKPMIKCSC